MAAGPASAYRRVVVTDVNRRTLLAWAGASVALGGCADDAPSVDRRPIPGAAPTASRTPTAAPTLPPPAAYEPLPGEPVPMAKRVAAQFAQAVTTRRAGQRPEDVLATATSLTGTGFDAAAALATAAPLYPEPVSSGEIVYPQIGGLQPLGPGATSAAVLVVVRQRLLTPRRSTYDVVRTLDVELAVQDGSWRVVQLASAGGEPVARPAALDPRAQRALDHPSLELPDSAKWDAHAGRVSLELLDLLASLADTTPLSVSVIQTGHPRNVFGTDRVSDHSVGRAGDVWRIAGQPVVSTGASTGPASQVLRRAFADPRLAQAGSPPGSDLDGRGRRSFNDLVHKDHLHLAVRGASLSGG